ncbi:MAG: hypothetical protein EOP49_00190, partial [Sphingobacteriales bacterium]
MKGSFTLKIMGAFSEKKSQCRLGFLSKKSVWLFAALLTTVAGWSQNSFSGASGGNWGVTTNWSLGHVPTSTETVTIPNSKSVTVNVAATCASLSMSSGGFGGTNLTISGSNTLTVGGAVTVAGASLGARTLNVGAGTLTCGSLSMSGGTVGISPVKVSVSTGKITVNGNISMSGSSLEQSLEVTSTGILEIGGAMPATNGYFVLNAASTVRYIGTNQNIYTKGQIGDLSYGNIELLNSGNKTPLGNFYVAGNWTNNANFAAAGSTVSFIGSGAVQTIGGTSATTFNNLSILRGNPTTLASDVSVTGTLALGGLDPSLSLVDGQLIVANKTLTLFNAVTAGDGSFDNEDMIIADGAGVVRRSFSGTGSYTFPIGDDTGTVEYSPITVNVTSGSFSGAYVSVSVVDAKHPNNASSTNFISRYWNVTQTGIAGAVATVTGTCVAADVSGATTAISTGQLSGAFSQTTNPWIKFAAFSGNNFTAAGASLTAGVTSAFTGLTKAAPTVAISGGGTYCQNNPVTLTASPSGDASFLYSWSGGLGTANTASPSTASAGTTNYSVTVTDGNGFTGTNNTNVIVNAIPTFGSASQQATVCENSAATINLAGMLPGSTSSVSYTINGGPAQTATGVVADGSGNASFTATLSLANNGQLLSITGITRTGITPTCPFTPAANSTTLSVNQNVTYYADTDNDGFGNAGAASVSCFGAPAGFILDNTDCNDAVVYYQDLDADGFGSSVKINCGTVTNNTDCNDLVVYYQDNDADGFGSNVKVNCGTITNNTDCDDTQIFYEDIDGDGYGSTTMSACSNVLTSTDCNDNEASAHPGAAEIGYDLIDNDCDGLVDEGFPPKQTTLMTALCGVTLPGIDTPIYANLVAGAQGYRWRITTMIGTTPGQVQFLDTALRTMRLTQLPNYAFNTNYRVEVAVYYSNHLQPYLASTCEVTTPSPTTQLVDCGATLQNMTDIIYAGIVPYSKGYRFRITDPSSQSNTQVIDRNVREFRMNLVTSFFVQYGKTYNIECALKNTDGTYLPYGAACTVT